jgi:hypothetical protein
MFYGSIFDEWKARNQPEEYAREQKRKKEKEEQEQLLKA